MSALESLKAAFRQSQVKSSETLLSFEGTLEGFADGIDDLEQELGYQIPSDIAEFLRVFGGTRLFVDRFGLGVEVFPIAEISRRNHDLQETTGVFWPAYVIIGFDASGDMLCLHKARGQIHFGNLDHEAWGEPEVWEREALSLAPFGQWLQMFIETAGATIPTKAMRYEI